jgi:hypothetical protein
MAPRWQRDRVRMRGARITAAVCLVAGMVTSAPAVGPRAEAPKVLEAARVSSPPRIDGVLDDEAWTLAAGDDRFVQIQPLEREPPSERTIVRVAYDDDALYVSFDCHDRAPEGIVGRLTRRDRAVESDWVAFMVDSSDDRATGYAFRVNAAGVQRDSLWFNDVQQSDDWDAVWESAVHRHAGGWSAELRIPLSALRFPSRERHEWGFQAMRYISRKKEELLWSYIPRNAQGFVSRAGRLRGLDRLRPRRTTELRPYVAARTSSYADRGRPFLGDTAAPHRSAHSVDVGLDGKLGLTSDLTLDLSLNPDFGQIEADQIVLNLSRFETFFPEKRPFFLESLDLFQMPVQIFYTRRIGQSPNRLGVGRRIVLDDGRDVVVSEAPSGLRILGAAKLTGKVAPPLRLGLVHAVTGPEELIIEGRFGATDPLEVAPMRSYGVGRLRYDFGDASYIAAVATAVNRLAGTIWRAAADHDAYAGGIDGQWVITPDWRLLGQLLVSHRAGGPRRHRDDGTACPDDGGLGCRPITRSDGTRLEPGALGLGVNTLLQGSGQRFFFRAYHESYSARLDLNDLGFLPRWNLHELGLLGGYVDTRPGKLLRSFELLPGAKVATSFDGVLRDLAPYLYGQAVLRSYVTLSAELQANLPGTYDTHETFDGARFERASSIGGWAELRSDTRRPLVLVASGAAHRRVDATYSAYLRAELALQVVARLELSLTPEIGVDRALRFHGCVTPAGDRCDVEAERRAYTFGRLDSAYASATLRGAWTFSPILSLTAYAQLFLDRGRWSAYREAMTAELQPTIRRADLGPAGTTGDRDGDGVKDDDFEDASLNVNVVLRWEFRPGSTLIGVYSRSESSALRPSGAAPVLRLSGLGTGPTEDTFLLKLVFFAG